MSRVYRAYFQISQFRNAGMCGYQIVNKNLKIWFTHVIHQVTAEKIAGCGKDSDRTSGMAREMQYHERINGSGYPQGLKGDEILLEARILAVADTVEAMSTHGPYRAALGREEALAEISRNESVLYDSEVVQACKRLFTEKGFEF